MVEIRNNIFGNGIHSNRTTHYLKKNPSINYSRSSSSTSDVDKTTSLPQSYPTSTPDSNIDDGLLYSWTNIVSTKRITNNPLTDSALNMYDSTPRKNRLASVYSIRLTKTKSDTTMEEDNNPYPQRLILEGQTHPTKHLSSMNNINMVDSIKIPISLFHIRNKQQQQKNQNMVEQQQRILSTTKILNKRNAISNDINEGSEERKVPSEKQQHKRHAFNDTTNGFGNGTDEQGISRNDLPFLSNSNIPSDQSPQNIRPLSIEVNDQT